MNKIEFEFMQFVGQFGKNYASIEEYEHRLEMIAAHQSADYELGHNKMSDWTVEEYNAMLTYVPQGDAFQATPVEEKPLTASPKDWRISGCLSSIKDQGQCGSCWSFSGIATMENVWCNKHSKLYSLSEQQIVDCQTQCYGCNGGWADKVWTYLQGKYAMTESAYPYTARDGTCKYSSSNATPVKAS